MLTVFFVVTTLYLVVGYVAFFRLLLGLFVFRQIITAFALLFFHVLNSKESRPPRFTHYCCYSILAYLSVTNLCRNRTLIRPGVLSRIRASEVVRGELVVSLVYYPILSSNYLTCSAGKAVLIYCRKYCSN